MSRPSTVLDIQPNERLTPQTTGTPPVNTSASPAVLLQANTVSRVIDGERILSNVTLQVRSGEILGVAGGSGAGKTTLLETLANIQVPTTGCISLSERSSSSFGFVPQDDIIHLDLPLGRTLEIAAELRMSKHTSAASRSDAVTRVLTQLKIDERRDVKVRSLSGGQRKRASIAAELLTEPAAFFLDEPTSGLDPATASSLMSHLRAMAEAGTAVVLTTHAPSDLSRCDRVVFLAKGGRIAFVGTPAEAKLHFRTQDLSEVYGLLESNEAFETHDSNAPDPTVGASTAGLRSSRPTPPSGVGWIRQWKALTGRTLDLQVRNPLTLSILVGSPAGVVGMLAVLFPSGAFGGVDASALSAIQLLFWVTFSSFFFGVTYGLLQIVGEVEVLRREHRQGLRLSAYVMSKVTVLAPLLLAVNLAMLGVLRLLDRLPTTSRSDWVLVLVAAWLTSFAGVAFGLLASSLVQNPAQATLALPMICFPQVLFAGAAIPVSQMTNIGAVMSLAMANRWGFESMGRTLQVAAMSGEHSVVSGFEPTFSGSSTTGLAVLAALSISAIVATVASLTRRLQ